MEDITLQWYKEQAKRTCYEFGDILPDLTPYTKNKHILHMKLGIIGELGEVTELIKKKWFYGSDIKREDLVLELGDIYWYAVNWANDLTGISLDNPEIDAKSTEDKVDYIMWIYPQIISNGENALQQAIDLTYVLGLTPKEVMLSNILKLKKRYPDKFDAKLARERD